MRVYFLGTGTSQGIPVIGSSHPVCLSEDPRDKRLRVSVWIHWEGGSFVIDCGPDFRQQMLISKCPRLDGILFTHEHADHTAGLDDIRPFNFFQKQKIPLFAHPRVIENLQQRFAYIFEQENRYPGAPEVSVHPIGKDRTFSLGDKTCVPIEAWHGKLPVLGFRIEGFAYLTDVKSVEEQEMEKLKSLDVLVINALREEEHESHFTLSQALDFIHLVKPRRTYLTHISHVLGFHEEVQKKLPPGVFLAYDNLEIQL